MKRFLLVFVISIWASVSISAKDFYMITPSVKNNHLKFKQTDDHTWLMYIPATYPCPAAGNDLYTGFKFMVGDEGGYLYTPTTAGSTMINDVNCSGTLEKSSSKRPTWWNWNGNYLEVKKDVADADKKNPYYGMTSSDLLMDGCLEFTITLENNGNLSYHAVRNPDKRVSYAACNTTEGSDNGTYYEAKHTNFLFADRNSDGTFSPYYQGKIGMEKLPSENYDNIKHNGFYFYTPIQETPQHKYEGDGNDWWKQVGNDLGTRGISPDYENLYANGGNYESPLKGSYKISTTFYYGKNTQGKMGKKLDEAYDHPLAGSIRTYCNEEKNMKNRYHVRSFLVTGYKSNGDEPAFELTEVPYVPAKVGVILYTEDATVDVLAPSEEWTGAVTNHIEDVYGHNYLVPTFKDTPVSTYSSEQGKQYINFFLSKLFTTVDYKNNQDGKYTDVENYWGFFSILNTQVRHANRAYLHFPYEGVSELTHWVEASSGTKGAKYVFSGGNHSSGIKKISSSVKSTEDDSYYTLDGRKVGSPSHGIYIHKGKKYLFK